MRERLRKAEKILADDRRLQTNGISSEEDTDARVGRKSRTHLYFGYKQHMTMADGDEIITACTLTPGNADDGRQLPDLLKQSTENTAIAAVVADAAYGAKANLEMLQSRGVEAYIPLRQTVYSSGKLPAGFAYNKDSNEMTCPAGYASYRRSRHTDTDMSVPTVRTLFFFDPKICRDCPLREGCYTGQKTGKSISVYEANDAQEATKLRNETVEARVAACRRKTIEHKFAELKRFCGLRRARYRSLLRVFLQAVMACFVANAKRMVKLEAWA